MLTSHFALHKLQKFNIPNKCNPLKSKLNPVFILLKYFRKLFKDHLNTDCTLSKEIISDNILGNNKQSEAPVALKTK